MEINFFTRVYSLVKQIPVGRVSTYGEIARVLGTRDARKVGWALHANRSSEVPCHRVVSKTGKLAAHFAFDGWQEQRHRLEMEQVEFVDEMHVDLPKYGYGFGEK